MHEIATRRIGVASELTARFTNSFRHFQHVHYFTLSDVVDIKRIAASSALLPLSKSNAVCVARVIHVVNATCKVSCECRTFNWWLSREIIIMFPRVSPVNLGSAV